MCGPAVWTTVRPLVSVRGLYELLLHVELVWSDATSCYVITGNGMLRTNVHMRWICDAHAMLIAPWSKLMCRPAVWGRCEILLRSNTILLLIHHIRFCSRFWYMFLWYDSGLILDICCGLSGSVRVCVICVLLDQLYILSCRVMALILRLIDPSAFH